MNITTQALLESSKKAITDYDRKRAVYDEAVKVYIAKINVERAEKALEGQKRVRDALSLAVKAKKPLTTSELETVTSNNRSSYLSYLGFSSMSVENDAPRTFVLDGQRFERPGGIPRADLEALIATLENITEETISDGQLQRLGFKNMGWVFRAAVANA